ncbi:MAG: hypothetical protein ACHQCH_03250 [Solirubrobacterales bacterium]
MPNRRPELHLIAPTAAPEQAAAIVAAIERFMRETAPRPSPGEEGPDPWQHAAILEGIERECQGDVPDPWINP